MLDTLNNTASTGRVAGAQPHREHTPEGGAIAWELVDAWIKSWQENAPTPNAEGKDAVGMFWNSIEDQVVRI